MHLILLFTFLVDMDYLEHISIVPFLVQTPPPPPKKKKKPFSVYYFLFLVCFL
jgi:hypothetical protein